MLYRLARQALFTLDPERAHHLSLQGLKLGRTLGVASWFSGGTCSVPSRPVECMGLQFPNAVGVAAGLDKDAEYFEALGNLGFGFVEVGTVTPRPQPGNPAPRVFRLPRARALINRLGFNSKGVDHLVERVRSHRFRGVLGINIGKNADTPLERAEADYLYCLERVYPYAGYVTVNVSSPNTRGLRELQQGTHLEGLLAALADRRITLRAQHGRQVPIAVKVAPDLGPGEIGAIADCVARNGMEAVIATNTTVSREGVSGLPGAEQEGGLSGAPLKRRADEVLAAFRRALPDSIALIGVGGIGSGQDAVDKLARGARLVQFYTGMIYRGPALLRECRAAIHARTVP